jgi:hypothetical protein
LHAYPPKLPKQVHLRCVLLTSYRFLQTLPLASNALAIRIIFPLSRGDSGFFQPDGFASFAGQTKKPSHYFCEGFLYRLSMLKATDSNRY